jgi:hypothetical protein
MQKVREVQKVKLPNNFDLGWFNVHRTLAKKEVIEFSEAIQHASRTDIKEKHFLFDPHPAIPRLRQTCNFHVCISIAEKRIIANK